MAASLDTLPTELLDNIAESLVISDLVSFWKCSRSLQNRFGRALFGSPDARNHTLRWACSNGDIDIIRAAVSYGADPSFFEVAKKPRATTYDPPEWWIRRYPLLHVRLSRLEAETGPFRASTLAVTARKGHADAFNALRELGATLKGASVPQRKALMRALRRRRGWTTAVQLLAEGKAPESKDDRRSNFTIVSFIQRGAPVDLVRKLLERGMSPNLVVRNGPYFLASPLSAAVQRGSVEMFDLLMEYGAEVNVAVEQHLDEESVKALTFSRPRHIPVFAAAKRMGKTGSTDMMDCCLRHGADINTLAPSSLGASLNSGLHTYFITSPYLTYLESILKWPSTTGLLPEAGIAYFQNKSAAKYYLGRSTRARWPALISRDTGYSTMSSVQLLLTRWGVRMLEQPQFFETIKHLITTELLHHKESLREAWRILTHFSQDFSVGNSSRPLLYRENPNNTDHIPEWWSIAGCLLDQLEKMYPKNYEWLFLVELREKTQRLVEADSSSQDAKDSVLYDMLLYYFQRPGTYGMFARLLVDRLIARGANINARAGMCDETILYLFCCKVNRAIYDEESGPHRIPRRKHFIYDLCLPWMKDSIKAFAMALLAKGTDPLIEVRGFTALELLKSGYSDMVQWKQMYLEEVEAAILLGRSEFLEHGPTPNLKAWRPNLRDYRWEEHIEANNIPTHRERPEKLVWPYGGGPGPALSAGYFRADDYDTLMYLRTPLVHG